MKSRYFILGPWMGLVAGAVVGFLVVMVAQQLSGPRPRSGLDRADWLLTWSLTGAVVGAFAGAWSGWRWARAAMFADQGSRNACDVDLHASSGWEEIL